MRGAVLIGSIACVLVSGCAAGAEPDAAAVAGEFLAASPDRACALLAPGTAETLARTADGDCADALRAVRRPGGTRVLAVEIAGLSAQVRLADDVVFLAHFGDGWRVTAAGCARPSADSAVPYECAVRP